MNLKKLTHSKCPYCKEYGPPAIKTGRRFSPETIQCEHCKKTFATNWGINLLVEFGSLALVLWINVGWASEFFTSPTAYRLFSLTLCVVWVILTYLYEYFAPLHERE